MEWATTTTRAWSATAYAISISACTAFAVFWRWHWHRVCGVLTLDTTPWPYQCGGKRSLGNPMRVGFGGPPRGVCGQLVRA